MPTCMTVKMECMVSTYHITCQLSSLQIFWHHFIKLLIKNLFFVVVFVLFDAFEGAYFVFHIWKYKYTPSNCMKFQKINDFTFCMKKADNKSYKALRVRKIVKPCLNTTAKWKLLSPLRILVLLALQCQVFSLKMKFCAKWLVSPWISTNFDEWKITTADADWPCLIFF